MRMYALFSSQRVQRSGSCIRDQSSPVTGACRCEVDVQHAAHRVHSVGTSGMLPSMRILAMLALFALGCTAHQRPAARAVLDLDSAITAWTSEDTRPPTVVLRPITEPVRVAPREPRSPVPLGPRISAHFDAAPLASALRFLAEASDLGIVIGEGIEGSVSADLRDVRSVTAMQTLAEAHGVELSFVGRTVIARPM
jgi:hypothetical protein